MNRFANLVVGVAALGAVGLAGATAQASVVISYDAATEFTSTGHKTPDEVTPAWSIIGNASNGYNTGSYLIHNAPASTATSYTSPQVAGTMVKGSTNYTVQFRVQPTIDLDGGYWYARNVVLWADDVSLYSLILDKDTDDGGAGTTGGIRYGAGSVTSSRPNVLSGIDWSSPHTVAVSYTGSNDTFAFYLDGVFQTTLPANTFAAAATYAGWQDALTFGATANSDGAQNNNWYSLSVSNTAVPEPVSLALLPALGLMAMRRRRRAR